MTIWIFFVYGAKNHPNRSTERWITKNASWQSKFGLNDAFYSTAPRALRQAYKKTIGSLSWERSKTGSSTEATDNVEKETTGDVHLATKCTADHSGTNKTRGIEPKICQTIQNVRCGLWTLFCGHGVSKWLRKSYKIKEKSRENLSQIDENLLSGRLGWDHFGTQIAPRPPQGRGCSFVLSLLWFCGFVGSWVVGSGSFMVCRGWWVVAKYTKYMKSTKYTKYINIQNI